MWFRISRDYSIEAGEYLYKLQFLDNAEEPIDLNNIALNEIQLREIRIATFKFVADVPVSITAEKYSLNKEDI